MLNNTLLLMIRKEMVEVEKREGWNGSEERNKWVAPLVYTLFQTTV